MRRAILAVDEGTTNCKAVLVGEDGAHIAAGSAPVPIAHPRSGWVEQDADAIWTATRDAIGACCSGAENVEIAAIGLSNQRESILMWDRATGAPLGPVVSWQCRRTAAACEALREAGHEADVIARTGLPLDPMFSATKAAWLYDTFAGGRSGREVCIGTVDSWLIWKLTGGGVHATDRSNAARTQLFSIADARWDETLCALFGVPLAALPSVHDSAHIYGTTDGAGPIADGTPIAAAIGDSHAALFGNGAFATGDAKMTFGTGSSVMRTVPGFVAPPQGITTTIAWSLAGVSTFALEGNILVSASILPWTATLLGLPDVAALLTLAQTVDDAAGVCLVPAHVGLGSPHWDTDARGLICGLSFGAGPPHVARAAAESIAFQVNDVHTIMQRAAGPAGRLFVDGGPSRDAFLMSLVAATLGEPIRRCDSVDASARGAAWLAGLATGIFSGLDEVARIVGTSTDLTRAWDQDRRERAIARWQAAVARARLKPDAL